MPTRLIPGLRLLTIIMCVLAFAFFSGATRAADTALMVPIGYSENHRYFAFEEFGIQDGTGLAFSTIYVVDIGEDHWVVGTPIRIIGETENDALASVRAHARDHAEPRLTDLKIHVPAQMLAANGDGAPDTDGTSLRFGLPVPGTAGTLDGDYLLELETFETSSSAPCMDWFGEVPLGFALRLTGYAPTREIHRDGVLPRSRGCPVAYRIQSVYMPFGARDIASAVALVSAYINGYEGVDRRFIAVPLARLQVGL